MEKAKRILVVDDEETLCDALAFNLEAEGYEVATAYSAEEALTHNLSDYDLLLLDIMMGEISGTQLARIMKSNPATASVPIIFCTAKDTEEDMIKGLDLGADDYIMKPYSLKAVLPGTGPYFRAHRRIWRFHRRQTMRSFTRVLSCQKGIEPVMLTAVR